MLEVVAVRHLPTKLNENGILQGHIDEDIVVPSSEILNGVNNNKKKIVALGPYDMKFTSTLRRTISTAGVYGYPEAIKEPLLDELDFGEYEGKHKSEMEAALAEKWYVEPQTLTLGEPVLDLERRVRSFVDMCSNYHRVLVFGHGAWMRALLSFSIYGDISKMNTMAIDNNDLKIVCFKCQYLPDK